MLGLLDRLQDDVLTMELVDVNGETGLCLRVNGQLTAIMSIVTDSDRISFRVPAGTYQPQPVHA